MQLLPGCSGVQLLAALLVFRDSSKEPSKSILTSDTSCNVVVTVHGVQTNNWIYWSLITLIYTITLFTGIYYCVSQPVISLLLVYNYGDSLVCSNVGGPQLLALACCFIMDHCRQIRKCCFQLLCAYFLFCGSVF